MAFGHLDADCFYVSAERVRNQFLQGKPVGVLGNQTAEAVRVHILQAVHAPVTVGIAFADRRLVRNGERLEFHVVRTVPWLLGAAKRGCSGRSTRRQTRPKAAATCGAKSVSERGEAHVRGRGAGRE
jgi:hypothetical protein